MVGFQSPTVVTVDNRIDLEKLGKVHIKDMKILPFVSVLYKMKPLMRDSQADQDLLKKYLKI